jgi:hypothetical protein
MLNLVQHLVVSTGQILKSETLILNDRSNLEFVSDWSETDASPDIRISSFPCITSFTDALRIGRLKPPLPTKSQLM